MYNPPHDYSKSAPADNQIQSYPAPIIPVGAPQYGVQASVPMVPAQSHLVQTQQPQSVYPPGPVMQTAAPSHNFYPAPGAPQQVPFGPYSSPAVPFGLQDILNVNQLIVEQQVEMLEAFTGYETNNKYIVKNLSGQHLYFAVEKNDLCTRNCLGEARPFTMKLYDQQKQEIIRLDRPWRCTSCLFPCFLQILDVYGSNAQVLGKIVQEWSIFKPLFSVLNGSGQKVLMIEGPLLTFSCCGTDVQFRILSTDGVTEVGKITKQWSGLARELFTDVDRFGIEFPRDLDVNIKAVLLGATFLIDFMYFEKGHR